MIFPATCAVCIIASDVPNVAAPAIILSGFTYIPVDTPAIILSGFGPI